MRSRLTFLASCFALLSSVAAMGCSAEPDAGTASDEINDDVGTLVRKLDPKTESFAVYNDALFRLDAKGTLRGGISTQGSKETVVAQLPNAEGQTYPTWDVQWSPRFVFAQSELIDKTTAETTTEYFRVALAGGAITKLAPPARGCRLTLGKDGAITALCANPGSLYRMDAGASQFGPAFVASPQVLKEISDWHIIDARDSEIIGTVMYEARSSSTPKPTPFSAVLRLDIQAKTTAPFSAFSTPGTQPPSLDIYYRVNDVRIGNDLFRMHSSPEGASADHPLSILTRQTQGGAFEEIARLEDIHVDSLAAAGGFLYFRDARKGDVWSIATNGKTPTMIWSCNDSDWDKTFSNATLVADDDALFIAGSKGITRIDYRDLNVVSK